MLNSFPVEVLELITSKLHGQYIGQLVFCGSKLLTHKLLNGGGVRDFAWSENINFRRGWPSMIPQFTRLSAFRLLYQSYFPPIPMESHNYHSLPGSLTEVEIELSEASDSFITFMIDHPDHFSDFRRLSLMNIKVKFDTILDTSPCISNLELLRATFGTVVLAQLPKNLTHLHVSTSSKIDRSHGVPFPVDLTYLNFSSTQSLIPSDLPRRLLTYISFPHYPPLSLSETIAEFPRTLTTLITSSKDVDAALVMGLPPNLTNLGSYTRVDVSLLHLLPPGLTRVSLKGRLTNDLVQRLPPALIELDADEFIQLTHDQFKLLPPSLRILRASSAPKPKATRLISSFPPQLLSLAISALGSGLALKVPKTLMSLEVDVGPLLQETVPLLPKSLTYLRVQGLLLEGSEDDVYLKVPVVETLVQTLSSKQKGEPILSFRDMVSVVPLLPKSLRSLIVFTPQFNNVGQGIKFSPCYCSLTAASGIHFSQFSSLRDLSLDHIKILDTDVLSHLPSTLNTLSLAAIDQAVLGCWANLPLSLRNLSVTITHPIPGFASDLMHCLPKQLAIFTYSILGDRVSDHEIDVETFSKLPSNTYYVSIPWSTHITQEVMAPPIHPNLRNFYLGGASPPWFTAALINRA